MNRSASAAYYPFQVMPRFLLGRQGEVYYIGGSDILPPPLETQREARILEKLGTPEEKEAKSTLIEHNLRLVVYIAKKFDNTGVSVEDLISIGTIGLIKAINTFNPVKNIKLATYASRCIENEILMYLRRNSKTKMEVSIDGNQASGKSNFQAFSKGTDDYQIAVRAWKAGGKGENTERSGGPSGDFTVLYFQAGKTDHEEAEEGNCKV